MTVTEVPKQASAELEMWRDQMIDLAHEVAITAYNDMRCDGMAAAVVANAMHDIRVRDVIIHDCINLSHDKLDAILAVLQEMVLEVLPQNQIAPVSTLASIILGVMGNTEVAKNAAGIALMADSEYSLAKINAVMLDVVGNEYPQVVAQTFGSMSRVDCRHGRN